MGKCALILGSDYSENMKRPNVIPAVRWLTLFTMSMNEYGLTSELEYFFITSD